MDRNFEVIEKSLSTVLKQCEISGCRISKPISISYGMKASSCNAEISILPKCVLRLNKEILKHDENHIRAIIAHELGHISNKDIIYRVPLVILTLVGVLVYTFHIFMYKDMQLALTGAMIAFFLLLYFLKARLSELQEIKADRFTARIGYGEQFIQVLEKGLKENPDDEKICIWFDLFFRTHPTRTKRINLIKKHIDKRNVKL